MLESHYLDPLGPSQWVNEIRKPWNRSYQHLTATHVHLCLGHRIVMKFHFSDSSVDIGLLLFRMLMAYSLLEPVRLIAISFTSGFGATIALVEVLAFAAFCGGAIFLILGFHTKSASLGSLIFLLTLRFAFQSTPFSI